MRKLLIPLLLLAVPCQAQHSATLSWSQPCPTCTTNIYRNTVKYVTGIAGSTLQYVDTTVAAGQTYSYYLTNVDPATSLESVPSNTVSGTVPNPAPGPTVSIWTPTTVPGHIAGNDGSSVELGMKFTASVSGQVVGVRFYKATNSTSTHTGTLWNSLGTKLDTGTFTGETASGWQTLTFATPVSIIVGATYTISYHTVQYAYDQSPAAQSYTTAKNVAPLTAPVNAGVYAYGATSTFPTSTYSASNYYADVVFLPGTPIVNIAIAPTTASLALGGTQQFTATVTNTTNTAVTWSANAPGGLYVAPTTLPSPAQVTVTATSVADPTKSASAVVTLIPPPLTWTCTGATCVAGGGTSGQTVPAQLNPPSGPSATVTLP